MSSLGDKNYHGDGGVEVKMHSMFHGSPPIDPGGIDASNSFDDRGMNDPPPDWKALIGMPPPPPPQEPPPPSGKRSPNKKSRVRRLDARREKYHLKSPRQTQQQAALGGREASATTPTSMRNKDKEDRGRKRTNAVVKEGATMPTTTSSQGMEQEVVLPTPRDGTLPTPRGAALRRKQLEQRLNAARIRTSRGSSSASLRKKLQQQQQQQQQQQPSPNSQDSSASTINSTTTSQGDSIPPPPVLSLTATTAASSTTEPMAAAVAPAAAADTPHSTSTVQIRNNTNHHLVLPLLSPSRSNNNNNNSMGVVGEATTAINQQQQQPMMPKDKYDNSGTTTASTPEKDDDDSPKNARDFYEHERKRREGTRSVSPQRRAISSPPRSPTSIRRRRSLSPNKKKQRNHQQQPPYSPLGEASSSSASNAWGMRRFRSPDKLRLRSSKSSEEGKSTNSAAGSRRKTPERFRLRLSRSRDEDDGNSSRSRHRRKTPERFRLGSSKSKEEEDDDNGSSHHRRRRSKTPERFRLRKVKSKDEDTNSHHSRRKTPDRFRLRLSKSKDEDNSTHSRRKDKSKDEDSTHSRRKSPERFRLRLSKSKDGDNSTHSRRKAKNKDEDSIHSRRKTPERFRLRLSKSQDEDSIHSRGRTPERFRLRLSKSNDEEDSKSIRSRRKTPERFRLRLTKSKDEDDGSSKSHRKADRFRLRLSKSRESPKNRKTSGKTRGRSPGKFRRVSPKGPDLQNFDSQEGDVSQSQASGTLARNPSESYEKGGGETSRKGTVVSLNSFKTSERNQRSFQKQKREQSFQKDVEETNSDQQFQFTAKDENSENHQKSETQNSPEMTDHEQQSSPKGAGTSYGIADVSGRPGSQESAKNSREFATHSSDLLELQHSSEKKGEDDESEKSRDNPDFRSTRSGMEKSKSKSGARKKTIFDNLRRKTTDTQRSRSVKSKEQASRSNKSHGQESVGSQGGSSRGGFFRNLFRKSKKQSSEVTPLAEQSAVSSRYQDNASTIPSNESRSDQKFANRDISDEQRDSRNTRNVNNDQPELFYANDDVSLLTNPTLDVSHGVPSYSFGSASRKKHDPSSISNPTSGEPIGDYWNSDINSVGSPSIDPFREPFYEEPSGTSFAREVKNPGGLELKVAVHHDPGGLSPIAASAHGRNTPGSHKMQDPSPHGYKSQSPLFHSHKDPAGESPLHTNAAEPSGTEGVLDPSPRNRRMGPISIDTGVINESGEPVTTPRIRNYSANSGRKKKTVSTLNYPPDENGQAPISPTRLAERAKARSPRARSKKMKEREELKRHPSISTAARLNANAVVFLHSQNSERQLGSDAGGLSPVGLLSNEAKVNSAKLKSSSVLFSSFSKGKFKSRKPGERPMTQSRDFSTRFKQKSENKMAKVSRVNKRRAKPKTFSKPAGVDALSPKEAPMNRDVTLKSFPVSLGYGLFREQREYNITIGNDIRVVPEKKPPSIQKYAAPIEESTLDPIQLAGRRLLAKAAIPIQAEWRRHLAQNAAVDRMWALMEIQSYVRRWRAEATLLACIVSAVTIQALFRGYVTRMVHFKGTLAAIQIQRIVRGHLVATNTFECIYKVILIQACVRSWITRLRIRRHLNMIREKAERKSTLMIQTWWRARSARLLYQFLVVDTIISQCAVRRYFARRHAKLLRIDRDNAAAVKIQAVWRGFQSYTDYLFCLVDIMHVQKQVRSFLAKREATIRRSNRAVLTIQTRWRCYTLCSKYEQYRSAVRIQKHWRCHMLRSKYEQYQSAVVIQKHWRRHSLRSKFAQYRSAVEIQKYWRCYRLHSNYKLFLAAVRIQKHWRCHSLHNSYRRNRAAVKVQSVWRCFRAYTDFLFDLADIIRVQRTCRAWSSRRKVRARKVARASTKIQAMWRCHRALTEYRTNRSATRIQSSWRGFKARSNLIMSLANIIIAQCVARSYMAKQRVIVLQTHRAAGTIQASFRRLQACRVVTSKISRIVVLQSLCRRFLARKVAHRYRLDSISVIESSAATTIQAMWRGFRDFSQFVVLLYEVVRMQSMFRGNVVRREFNLQLGCCIMIQAAVRRHFEMKKLELVQQLVTLQKAQAMRERIACQRIQFWWRVVLECQREKRAALLIERFFYKIMLDIDREITEREQKKLESMKEAHRRKKKKARGRNKDQLCLSESASSHTDVFAFSPSDSDSDIFDFSPKANAAPDAKTGTPPSASSRSSSASKKRSEAGKKSPYSQHSGSPASSHQRNRGGRSPSHATRRPNTPESVNSGVSSHGSRSVGHRASSPSMKLIMRHENDSPQNGSGHFSVQTNKNPRGERQRTEPTSTRSIGSARSAGSPSTMSTRRSRKSASSPLRRARELTRGGNSSSRKLVTTSLAEEEAILDRIGARTGRSQTTSKFLEKYGLHSAPSRPEGNPFFGDELESEGSSYYTAAKSPRSGISFSSKSSKSANSKPFVFGSPQNKSAQEALAVAPAPIVFGTPQNKSAQEALAVAPAPIGMRGRSPSRRPIGTSPKYTMSPSPSPKKSSRYIMSPSSTTSSSPVKGSRHATLTSPSGSSLSPLKGSRYAMSPSSASSAASSTRSRTARNKERSSGKILVINPYPSDDVLSPKSQRSSTSSSNRRRATIDDMDEDELGEGFGMI